MRGGRAGDARDIGMELGCIIGKRRDYGREQFYRAARVFFRSRARCKSCRKDSIRGYRGILAEVARR